MLILSDVSLYFVKNEHYILENINWSINPGEKWILFGKNGSGKTKLLEIITGYRYPSSGEVIRFGNKKLGHDIRETRRRIGYVSTNLKDRFSKKEKITDVIISGIYGSIGLYQEPGKNDMHNAAELLSTAKLADRADDYFGTLSDGEKQKVMVMRSLINDPDILILDEASKGLDLAAREDLLHTLEKLTERKEISLVYVTHHTEEITPLFSSIFILDKGRCFYCGGMNKGLTSEIMSGLFDREVVVHEYSGRHYLLLQ